MAGKPRPVAGRFEQKVLRLPISGCWLWTGATFKSGYGQLLRDNKKVHAHRIAWNLYRGSIPDGLYVLHKCDVHPCVNPHHLFLGTHADNMADMIAKNLQDAPRGERQHCAKLTEAQIIDIRTSTDSLRAMARKYNVRYSNISMIRRRQTWKHI
jgi:hypothetical protein